MKPKTGIPILVLFFVVAASGPVSAAVALLVGEPFGKFGYFNPTGHAAIYLSNICAQSPTALRLCHPGEPGTVISRYGDVAGLDWIAIPPMPYLYAVEQPAAVPEAPDKMLISRLRNSYRRERLRDLIPDDSRREMPKGDWIQLVGSAYDRNIYGFAFDTTVEDDERLIGYLNSRPNGRRFNLFWRNCADFAREILNLYLPGTVGRNIIGDFGIMTPKYAAKSLVKYSQRQPHLQLTHFIVPQVAGGRASARIRGVNESLIRSKKYSIPLVIVQPWLAGSALVAYLTSGRFNPGRYSPAQCETIGLTTCMAGKVTENRPLPVRSEVLWSGKIAPFGANFMDPPSYGRSACSATTGLSKNAVLGGD